MTAKGQNLKVWSGGGRRPPDAKRRVECLSAGEGNWQRGDGRRRAARCGEKRMKGRDMAADTEKKSMDGVRLEMERVATRFGGDGEVHRFGTCRAICWQPPSPLTNHIRTR